MKFIHKATGIDIWNCDDNEILKEILIDEMTTINFKLKKYAEFCVMSDRKNLPLLEPQDFFKKYYED